MPKNKAKCDWIKLFNASKNFQIYRYIEELMNGEVFQKSFFSGL